MPSGALPLNVRRSIAFGAVFALVVSSSAMAGAWSNASGSNTSFGWSGGFNNTDHFGNPTVTVDGFFFLDPVDFRADGGGGIGESTTDFARTTVNVNNAVGGPGPDVHQVIVEEWGHWYSSETGPGGLPLPGNFTVQADFQMGRQMPFPPGSSGPLSLPVTFLPDGTWHAERTLIAGQPGNPPFSNLDWKIFVVTVTNTIQVSGAAAEGSWIEKDGMRIITPEPTAGVLLLVGFGTLALRRSRR